MKRIALLYILQSVFSIAAVAQVFHPDSLRYRIMDDGTAEVIGCTAREGIAIIPEKTNIDGKEYTVTSIGDGAFALPERFSVESMNGSTYNESFGWGFAAVYLPETVTSIGNGAFKDCSRMTFVRMPGNLISIGFGAFAGCISLGHIDLPQTLQTLGGNALNVAESEIGASASGIYTIGTDVLPNLTSVGGSALAKNRNLQQFPMTDKVTELGASAFANCSSLKSVHLSQSLTEIPDGLLNGCRGITSVELPSGIKRIGNSAFAGTGISQMNLPQGVTHIGNSAFAGSSISKVSLPQNVNYIGSYAFSGTPISSINLSSYTGEIGELAFNDCYNLSSIYVSPSNRNCYTSADGKAMFRAGSRELLTVLPSVEHLTIQYPATGKGRGMIYANSKEWSASEILSHSNLVNLTSLELPCTWDAALEIYAPQLRELVVRRAEPFPMQISRYGAQGQQSDSLDVQVFDYSLYNFQNARRVYGYNEYYDQWSASRYTTIDRPTTELYLQEVAPMYPGMQRLEGDRMYSWNADWNTMLQDKHPEYFALIDTLRNFNFQEEFRDYRSHHVDQYMASGKYDYYKWHHDTIVHCIDGELRTVTDFDADDYVNWYLSKDTVYAGTVYNTGKAIESKGYIDRIETEQSQGVPGNAYWVMRGPSATTGPTFYYALRMVPGLTYDIYALMAPRLGWTETIQVEDSVYNNDTGYYNYYLRDSLVVHDEQVMAVNTNSNSEQYGDTIPAMSMVQSRLYYMGIKDEKVVSVSLRSDVIPVTYNGTVQPVLLCDSVVVERDYYNYIEISGTTKYTDRKNGYVTDLAIVGILAKAREEVPVLPTGVEEMPAVAEHTAVAYYDLQGRRHSQPVRGVNIVRYSDGTTRRILVK